jgi:5-methylcytosine-specific restriction endonuclease McrA
MAKKRRGTDLSCKGCNKIFYVPDYRKWSAKFCSIECQNHKQYQRPTFECHRCKNLFTSSPSRRGKRKYCSIECSEAAQIERNADIRKKRRDRIAKLREKGLVGNSGAASRKRIFLIKEAKCMVCGYDEYKCCLDVHHIDGNPGNNISENLSILCVMCHRKVHRKIISLNGTK